MTDIDFRGIILLYIIVELVIISLIDEYNSLSISLRTNGQMPPFSM